MALRPFTEDDIAAVESWYRKATAAVHGLPSEDAESIQNLYYQIEEARSEANGGLLAISCRGDDAPIGLLDYRLGVAEEGWLGFGLVAVEPRLRGLGFGSEAVRLVEEDTLERGLARRFWAAVHRDNGLGFYFWLRLGYRPARGDEGRWPGERGHDIIVMIRVAESR